MIPIGQLNYHHLRYFWMVAREGSLTRAARQLRVSPSSVSGQIRMLEEAVGVALFHREHRALALTESGRIAFAYAERIFGAGEHLLQTLARGRDRTDLLRIGAVATLSRNFQESFVRPLIDAPDVRLRLVSAGLDELIDALERHELDLVLANRPGPRPEGPDGARLRSVELARQEVSLVGHPGGPPMRFPDGLHDTALLLPSPESETRRAFDAICARHGIRVRIKAEVDDMALLRLFARDADAPALLPSVVVRDELRAGILEELMVVPGLYEAFYAITAERQFQHPLLEGLLERDAAMVLGPIAP